MRPRSLAEPRTSVPTGATTAAKKVKPPCQKAKAIRTTKRRTSVMITWPCSFGSLSNQREPKCPARGKCRTEWQCVADRSHVETHGPGNYFNYEFRCLKWQGLSNSGGSPHFFGEYIQESRATEEPMSVILLVEDHPTNRKLFRDILQLQFEVMEAESAERALDLLHSHTPDLILMDMQLPGMDGLSLVRHLKTNPGQAAIPIIAVSAHALPRDIEQAR